MLKSGKRGDDVEIEYKRSARRTLAIQVTGDGSVRVLMPTRFPMEEAERFVLSKLPWIRKTQKKRRALTALAVPFTEEEKAAFFNEVKEKIEKKVQSYAEKMGVSYGKIRVRYMRSLWGSCTKCGDLSFNALLGAVPVEVYDYVVVHELAHRREMNHSARFYQEIEKILPYYKEPRKWLKDNGRVLMARAFPETGEREKK